MTKAYSAISLFSGAMGLDVGLERTGRFRVLAAVEKERPFCETIRANREAGRLDPGLALFEGDIRGVDPADVLAAAGLKPGQLDVLVGGPPCQSFSTVGKRGTTQDPRGTLLWEYLRFVDHMRPRFFLMENVRGLLSAALRHRPMAERPENGGEPLADDERPGSVIRLFADDLQKIAGGYHMDCFEVNAVNYGAPQLRERAIFVGNRFNSQVEFPDPTHGAGLLPWGTLGEAIAGVDRTGDEVLDFSPRKKSFLGMVPPGSNWRSLPLQVQKDSMGGAWHAKGGRSGWWRRLSLDLPCPTLTTMPNHASTSLCHPDEVRALSFKEYAAIQEFPEGWEFRGTTSQKYAQVGNAVPVRLGLVAGRVVAEALDEIEGRGSQILPAMPSHYRVVYVQSHVRTRQWFKEGEAFVWEEGTANEGIRCAAPATGRRVKKMAAEGAVRKRREP